MPGKRFSKKGIALIIGTCVLLALAFAARNASATTGCKKVSGKFTLTTLTGPECTSPVSVCATGIYKGDIAGSNTFTGTSFIPSADTPTTSVIFMTGDNIFDTKSGNLFTKDAIALRTTGKGEFAEVDTIIGGTGDWAGATGTLQAVGTFTASGGEGEYTGEVCFP